MTDQVAPFSDIQEVKDFLKRLHLFQKLSDEDLTRLAGRFDRFRLEPGDVLFEQGDKSQSFFVILKGSVSLTRRVGRKQETSIGRLVMGDYVGEMGLLRRRPRSARATAAESSEVLKLDLEQFRWMIKQFPDVLRTLEAATRSYELANRKGFDWLAPDEPVHMIARRHVSQLLIVLSFPVVILGGSFGMMGIGVLTGFSIFGVLGWLGVAVGSGWFLWNYIDWSNDYYIVTDRRVVWLEEVLFFYESRHETPLSQVQSVDIASTQIQRILGMGDVIVRTFSGSMTMTKVGSPEIFKAPIVEYRERMQRQAKMAEVQALTARVRSRIDKIDPRFAAPAAPAPAPTPAPAPKKSVWNDVLKMRFEKDGVVTYRKHWALLVWRVGGYILGFAALSLIIVMEQVGWLAILSIQSLMVILGLYVLIVGPIAGYQYLDWRNDQYQITDKSIIDLERKPFGTEVKKSAMLENVLSVTNRREGFIGYILNYGTVDIRVGDAMFNFIGVSNPAEVQQEVFDRYYARKRALEKEQELKKEEDMLRVVERYHDVIKNRYIPADPGRLNPPPVE